MFDAEANYPPQRRKSVYKGQETLNRSVTLNKFETVDAASFYEGRVA